MTSITAKLAQGYCRVYEGAAGNLPDSASEVAAKEILSVASSCNEGDILLALISGGGSALLSYPIDGITIEEKRKVQLYPKLYLLECSRE